MEREKRFVQMILLSLFKQFVDILKLSQASVLYCGVDFVNLAMVSWQLRTYVSMKSPRLP